MRAVFTAPVFFLVTIGIGSLFLGLTQASVPKLSASKPSEQKPAIVFVTAVQSKELFDSLAYPARVVPKINTTVLADTDGVISKIASPLGHKVKRGQLLMKITHTDPVFQYAPARVTSPVEGVVSLIDVTEGTQVVKGQKLAAVTDPNQLQIMVEIPALDLSGITANLLGDFRISGKADVISVRVRGISPFVDPSTGTASCEIEVVPGNQVALYPGLLGQIRFKTNLRKGVSITENAIIYKGSDTFVRLLENGQSKQVAVKLGRKQGDQVEIVSGLSESAKLIERTSRYIADGETVVVETAKP